VERYLRDAIITTMARGCARRKKEGEGKQSKQGKKA